MTGPRSSLGCSCRTQCRGAASSPPTSARRRRRWSRDGWFSQENDPIALHIEPEQGMPVVALRIHEHRLAQPPARSPVGNRRTHRVAPGPEAPADQHRSRSLRPHGNGRSPAPRPPARRAAQGTPRQPGGRALPPPGARAVPHRPRSTGTSSRSHQSNRGPPASPPSRYQGHARPAVTPSGQGRRGTRRHPTAAQTPRHAAWHPAPPQTVFP